MSGHNNQDGKVPLPHGVKLPLELQPASGAALTRVTDRFVVGDSLNNVAHMRATEPAKQAVKPTVPGAAASNVGSEKK